MYVECLCHCGFEDQITKGKKYQVQQIRNNSYSLVNDKGVTKWYGTSHFGVTFF